MKFFYKIMAAILTFTFIIFSSAAFADAPDDLYSKLKCCPCGRTVATCDCIKAKELKAYVDGLLERGLDKEEVLTKVAGKYSLDTIMDKETRKKIEKKLVELAPKERPEIFIHPLSYNLGKVSKSQGKLKLVVPVENKGKKVLKITELKTSCGCTTVKLRTKNFETPFFGMDMGGEVKKPKWEARLAPGEKGELIIVTDLNHPHVKIGHLLRVAEVISNDPIHSLVNIEVEADITE